MRNHADTPSHPLESAVKQHKVGQVGPGHRITQQPPPSFLLRPPPAAALVPPFGSSSSMISAGRTVICRTLATSALKWYSMGKGKNKSAISDRFPGQWGHKLRVRWLCHVGRETPHGEMG